MSLQYLAAISYDTIEASGLVKTASEAPLVKGICNQSKMRSRNDVSTRGHQK